MLDANERHLPSALLHCALCPEADPSGQHQQAPLVSGCWLGMAIGRHWPENGGREEREVGSLSHPQERFNKDLEEIKKSQYIMNNAVSEI